MWPDFCSALIVGRLAPLGLHDTRFRSVPVSCGPRAGADASSPRHETRRNVANSRSLKSRKGLRRQTSSVLYAPSALPAMALPYESPTVPVGGGMPNSPTPVAYTRPMHRAPWPERCTRPSAPPCGAAHDIACSSACSGSPGVHGGGARPAGDHAGEHVGGERRVAEQAVGHAHVGDVGHVRPVRRLRLEPAFHEIGPAARALRRSGGDGRPAADSRFPHDVRHLAAADPG